MSPVATGGMTSGSDTNVSISARPGNFRRASSQASTTPGGTARAVAPAAQTTVNQVIRQTSIFIRGASPHRTLLHARSRLRQGYGGQAQDLLELVAPPWAP
jgi:hypothetical protein